MKKLALHWKILLGMALGVIAGLLMTLVDGGMQLVQDWIKPFGKIFINSLKLIAIPLILAALIKGVSDLKDISKLSKMGTRTIIIYIMTTVIAVSIGLILVNTIGPGKTISEQTRIEMVENYSGSTQKYQETAIKQKESGPLQALEDLVPSNIFEAATSNRNMLQVIFFAVFFGIGLILIPEEKGETVKKFFDGFNEIILKMVDLIMLAAPYGVFALLASLVVESPSVDLFKALGWYAITVVLGLIVMIIIYIFIVALYTKKKPSFFLNGISPAQLLAFSTSSSAATLPLSMATAESKLGVDRAKCAFVLPLGATANMDGTALFEGIAAVFLAYMFGIDLSTTGIIAIFLVAMLSSVGAPGIPSGSMAGMQMVMLAVGIPLEAIGLLLLIERPLDTFRTAVNVEGDLVGCLVAKRFTQ